MGYAHLHMMYCKNGLKKEAPLKNGRLFLHEWKALKFTKLLIKQKIPFIYLEKGGIPYIDIYIFYGDSITIARERMRKYLDENALGKV